MDNYLSQNNVCFVANYSKTIFFEAVARRMVEQSIRVSWIVVNRKLYQYLFDRYPKEDLLLLNWQIAGNNTPPVDEFKLNELVYGDRSLKHRPHEALYFLSNIQRPIYDFLNQHKVGTVIGEITWAHELLIHRMVSRRSELACRYINPHTVRIPNGRFALFTDEFQTELMPSGESSGDYKINQLFKVVKPDYLARNDKLVKKARTGQARLAKMKRFITEENIDPLDPTLIASRKLRFKLRARQEINKETYYRINRGSGVNLVGKNYALVTLHKQPEASIDILGRYYENQEQNIRNLWRILPQNWQLVVKEHTNAIGDRPTTFYRNLQSLPNIMIINETADSHELIKNSKVVITVSGTVAYEAALMGNPALTLAPVFFNRLGLCRRITLDDIALASDIRALIPNPDDTMGKNREQFCRWLLEHSCKGIISDPQSNPGCMTDENLDAVANALMNVLRSTPIREECYGRFY